MLWGLGSYYGMLAFYCKQWISSDYALHNDAFLEQDAAEQIAIAYLFPGCLSTCQNIVLQGESK